ncbi:hypothetical protein ASD45_01275 [Pseudolabrys sp. Root1462]|nr:hypothetical protein ASD45_01275 [Pseudolabrys sp. Root1462]
MERLSDQILLLLHGHFFDDGYEYVPFAEIRLGIPSEPANAVKLELEGLISANKVIQETETRARASILGAIGPETNYTAKVDGYKISKYGISFVEKFEDEYYNQLLDGLHTQIPDAREDNADWEPLPLDRTDPNLNSVIKTLEKVIDDVHGDNGYSAEHPEERRYVQDKLTVAIKTLKEEASISLAYAQAFIVEPLSRLIKRFGSAALGVAATAAREAFTTWLKSKGINFLDDLFK